MYNSNIPSDSDLPSTGKLIKSTIIALVMALVLLVTVVMPAEYGIDPTGVGKVIGLKRMGDIKVSLAEEAAKDAEQYQIKVEEPVVTMQEKAKPSGVISTDERSFTLAPDQSTEIKLVMNEGAKVDYVWETDGGEAFFDVHGDSKALNINYHKYNKGYDTKQEGTLEAAFGGSHGWYFKNRTQEPLTVTLKVSGEFSEVKRY